MSNRLAFEIKRVIANAVMRELEQKTISEDQAARVSDVALLYFDESYDKREIFNNLEIFVDKYEMFARDMYGIKLQDFTD